VDQFLPRGVGDAELIKADHFHVKDLDMFAEIFQLFGFQDEHLVPGFAQLPGKIRSRRPCADHQPHLLPDFFFIVMPLSGNFRSL
jgi:hypothetical protein